MGRGRAGRGRRAGVVLLAAGPALVGAYALAGWAAVGQAAEAQVRGPGWEGGRIGPDGLTSLGVDAWRVVALTALVVGVTALAYLAVGPLLGRRSARGRTFLLVLSGFLIVPYALGCVVAFVNAPRLLGRLYQASDFVAGLPGWQPATAFLLPAAGLVQAAGLALTARRPPRRAPAPSAEPDQARPAAP
ncbi:hypothetical protein MF672_044310 [Actinomadura sp. ATCC 31491]|uniref:DUF2567 domain-containing protein n=1 Tax=Actinomadura luzonensis TaxID=2805427 RepID=A0ABT0G9L8_9ACTN|nr:hypothetical protein [Actinomadura luzonensis]MCK2220783.1 hypothetical protein [Actinomadura luzonensis]